MNVLELMNMLMHGMFDSITKKLSSNFVKNTAKTIGTKALEAGVSRFGSEIGARAADKVISTVRSTSNPPKDYKKVESVIEDSKNKPLGNVIVKELSKNNSLTSPKTIDLLNPDKINAMVKKQYYGYGSKKISH